MSKYRQRCAGSVNYKRRNTGTVRYYLIAFIDGLRQFDSKCTSNRPRRPGFTRNNPSSALTLLASPALNVGATKHWDTAYFSRWRKWSVNTVHMCTRNPRQLISHLHLWCRWTPFSSWGLPGEEMMTAWTENHPPGAGNNQICYNKGKMDYVNSVGEK